MDEFEDDDDTEINAPLDILYVTGGVIMMISGLILLISAEGNWKIPGALIFFTSFPIMTKKKKS
jgi:hypothetical protein